VESTNAAPQIRPIGRIRRTANRFDAIDAERFAEMLESESFRLVLERLEAEYVRASHECETATDLPQIYRAQGRVAALVTALRIPDQIRQEMQTLPKR
jgi:hypothetical protein